MSVKKQVSLHGRRAYITKDDQFAGRNGFVAGGVDKPAIVLPGSPDTVAIFDDFLGDTGRPMRAGTDFNWRVLDGDTGTDTGSNVYVKPSTSGVLRIKNGDTPVDQAKMGITGALNWKANQGSIPTDSKNGLRFGARVKISDTSNDTGTGELKDTGNSNVTVWMGFTDTIAAEAPVIDTGGAVVSTATDAVGVAFSSSRATRGAGDTGWVAYAVDGGTDATPVVLGVSPTVNAYDTIEIEIHHSAGDTGGTATFYVNGEAKGSIDNPVNMSTALAPQILLWGDTGGGQYVDIDWINVSGPRDTGI